MREFVSVSGLHLIIYMFGLLNYLHLCYISAVSLHVHPNFELVSTEIHYSKLGFVPNPLIVTMEYACTRGACPSCLLGL
jgi:hypothetical protein